MFQGWENFFYLVGSAAGALIGLMFIVITLAAGHDPRRVSRGAPVYVTPIVFHFGIVLIMSAISEVPSISSFTFGAILFVSALSGLVYSITTTIRLFRKDWEDTVPVFSDKCFYGLVPSSIYVALVLCSAAMLFRERNPASLIGFIMLCLLLLGIRNAWDLAITLAQGTAEEHHSKS